MPWTPLPVNYTDAMWSGLKKYQQITNADNTISLQDVTEYTNRENSFFGAADANRMNEALNTLMSMVEDGTNLYEAFQGYFATQQTLFEEEADSVMSGFQSYVGDLEAQGDAAINTIETEYATDMTNFKNQQESVFDVWFDMMKDQLSEDAAGNLQSQIGNLNELSTSQQNNLVTAINEVAQRSIPIVPDVYVTESNDSPFMFNVDAFPRTWMRVGEHEYAQEGFTLSSSNAESSETEVYHITDVDTGGWKGSAGIVAIGLPDRITQIDASLTFVVYSGTFTVYFETSSDGETWATRWTQPVTETSYNGVTLDAKYNRWRITGSGTIGLRNFAADVIHIQFATTDFAAQTMPPLVNGQSALVSIPYGYTNTGITANTINSVPVTTILRGGRTYRVVYNTTNYYATEVV